MNITNENADQVAAYMEKVDKVREQYEPRIKAILARTARAFNLAKLEASETFEISDDCYAWEFGIKCGPEEYDLIDFKLTIAESKAYDGSFEGINFIVDITHYQGHMVGGIVPFNYSDQVWVDLDDEDAIEERFCIIENADENSAVETVKNWLRDRKRT